MFCQKSFHGALFSGGRGLDSLFSVFIYVVISLIHNVKYRYFLLGQAYQGTV